MSKYKPGDRVVFNANLDKSPDPENAGVVGTILRYARQGEQHAGQSLRPECAFVQWNPNVIAPVMDDWLDPAPEVQQPTETDGSRPQEAERQLNEAVAIADHLAEKGAESILAGRHTLETFTASLVVKFETLQNQLPGVEPTLSLIRYIVSRASEIVTGSPTVPGAAAQPGEVQLPPDVRPLSMVTVYDHPSDFPEEYVARRCWIEEGLVFHEPDLLFRSKSLAEIDRQVEALGLSKIPNPGETDLAIVSVWA